jgi:hypothetical protein
VIVATSDEAPFASKATTEITACPSASGVHGCDTRNVVGLPLGGTSRRTTTPPTDSSTRATPALADAVESISTSCPTATELPSAGLLITTLTAPPPSGPQARTAPTRNIAAKPILTRSLLFVDMGYLLKGFFHKL